MPYDLDEFIADCRAILARDAGPAGREEVRVRLEQLLNNADIVRRTCGDDAPRGLKLLYEDDKLGFQILAHINDKARVSPPHDHGASWAIYGQATKYTDMIEWEREDNGSDAGHAKLTPVKKYRLIPATPASTRTEESIRSTTPTTPASSASPAPTSTGSIACASTSRPAKCIR
jgi:hypothetical protein